jgi:hypothetical protein
MFECLLVLSMIILMQLQSYSLENISDQGISQNTVTQYMASYFRIEMCYCQNTLPVQRGSNGHQIRRVVSQSLLVPGTNRWFPPPLYLLCISWLPYTYNYLIIHHTVGRNWTFTRKLRSISPGRATYQRLSRRASSNAKEESMY